MTAVRWKSWGRRWLRTGELAVLRLMTVQRLIVLRWQTTFRIRIHIWLLSADTVWTAICSISLPLFRCPCCLRYVPSPGVCLYIGSLLRWISWVITGCWNAYGTLYGLINKEDIVVFPISPLLFAITGTSLLHFSPSVRLPLHT